MIRKRSILAIALGVLLVAALPGAIAASSSTSNSASSSSASQNVNIPTENVLGALALGATGPGALQAISSGSSTSSMQSSASRSTALDLNDVLGFIALGSNGALGSGGFYGGGWGGSLNSLGTFGTSGTFGSSCAPLAWGAWMTTTPSWAMSSPWWCSAGAGASGVASVTSVTAGNQTVFMLPTRTAAQFLAAYGVTGVSVPVLVANNTTVHDVLANITGTATALAPGVTEVAPASGGVFVLATASDDTLSRL